MANNHTQGTQQHAQEQPGQRPGSSSPGDDWTSVTDPSERRKIQNRIAQRKFREKAKTQREDTLRAEDNQRKAAGSYTRGAAQGADGGEEGLPWGSISLRHGIVAGRAKEAEDLRHACSYGEASKSQSPAGVGSRYESTSGGS